VTVANNSQSCNRTTSECLCNALWNGTQCEIDMDEYEVNPIMCTTNTAITQWAVTRVHVVQDSQLSFT